MYSVLTCTTNDVYSTGRIPITVVRGATFVTYAHIMAALPPSPPSPPSAPPARPTDFVPSALTASDGEYLAQLAIGAWIALPISIFFVCSWAVYFSCFRRHKFSELYITSYLLGWSESTIRNLKQGHVTRSLRLEIRGSACARRARAVRVMEPTGAISTISARLSRAPAAGSEARSQASMPFDPDTLLNVCYAPNVPRTDSSLAAPISCQASSTRAPSGYANVIDLSDATDLMLRSTEREPIPVGFEPAYAYNGPSQSAINSRTSAMRRAHNSGLTTVAEEHQAGTWHDGVESQTTWISADEQAQGQLMVDVQPLYRRNVPRSGEDAALPSPREGSGYMLRI